MGILFKQKLSEILDTAVSERGEFRIRGNEGVGSRNWKLPFYIVWYYQVSFITTCLHLQPVLSFRLLYNPELFRVYPSFKL